MSNRGTHPNSHDALKKAAAAKSKNAKQVHITLSPEAIASATKAAQKLKISRSELFERYARSLSNETIIPANVRYLILREYGASLLQTLFLEESDTQSIGVFVAPPKVWLYFNQTGFTEICLSEPKHPEDCLEIIKGTDIWSYTNINAYLDGCRVLAEICEKKN